jgi:hypothetical protein
MTRLWARLTGAWKRFWGRLRRSHGGWGSEPQDDAHAYYRTQYERLVPVLPTLPRGQSHPQAHERKNTLLAFSSILEGLHNYGDNPILPPGIRRMVIRENQTRLQAFGEVGQPSLMGRFMAGLAPVLPYVLLIGAVMTVLGWTGAAWNGWRADRFEAQRDSARAERDAYEASRNAYAQALGNERAARARDVAAVLEDTARTVESLQRQRARDIARANRERSRREDLATGSVDFNERLRELAEPADTGLPATAAPEAGGDPASGVSAGARPAADDERSR